MIFNRPDGREIKQNLNKNVFCLIFIQILFNFSREARLNLQRMNYDTAPCFVKEGAKRVVNDAFKS